MYYYARKLLENGNKEPCESILKVLAPNRKCARASSPRGTVGTPTGLTPFSQFSIPAQKRTRTRTPPENHIYGASALKD